MNNSKTNISLFNTQRVEAFSDGVLAIVATLLILNIEVPENVPIEELRGEILNMWPHYLSYMLSFIIIGMYWYIHHVVMKLITQVDAVTLWLNLLFLMVVAYIPFPTELISEYRHNLVAVIFFGIIQVVSGFLVASMWVYSAKIKKHVVENLSNSIINKITIAVIIPPIINIAALFAAFINVYISVLLFFIAPVLYIVFARNK